jgi:hypothetical protein
MVPPPPASTGPSEPSFDDLEQKLVWIFGSPRTGSTWLLRMLRARREIAAIDETGFPAHLVPIGSVAREGEYFRCNRRRDDPNYFFAGRYLDRLGPELRSLMLRQLARQVEGLKQQPDVRWVGIKEPNGTHVADSVFWLLPRSRMVLLLRDGRDVIDSLADAMLGGQTWWRERHTGTAGATATTLQSRRAFIERHATQWVLRMDAARRAFDGLPEDQRLMVRYEELLTDGVEQLRRIYDWLELPSTQQQLEQTVAQLAYSQIDPSLRGPGTKFRAATPGLWREHFDDGEKELLQDLMGDTLADLGYEVT